MRIVVVAGVLAVLMLLLLPALAFAQSQEDFQVVKTERSESLVLPYTAVNRNEEDHLVYRFDEPNQPKWIFSIQNNESYVPREVCRTIIKI